MTLFWIILGLFIVVVIAINRPKKEKTTSSSPSEINFVEMDEENDSNSSNYDED